MKKVCGNKAQCEVPLRRTGVLPVRVSQPDDPGSPMGGLPGSATLTDVLRHGAAHVPALDPTRPTQITFAYPLATDGADAARPQLVVVMLDEEGRRGDGPPIAPLAQRLQHRSELPPRRREVV